MKKQKKPPKKKTEATKVYSVRLQTKSVEKAKRKFKSLNPKLNLSSFTQEKINKLLNG